MPGCQAPLPETAGYYGQVDWTELFENCPKAEESGVEAIDPIRTLFGLPDLPLEFIETTTMINSPHGDLLVARYQDTEGRNYFVEPQSNQIVEIDAREALSAIPPEAPAYPKEALSAKAEELIRGAIPNFDSLQAELSYEEGVKGDQYFFDWRAAITPGSFNPPLAQIGLHKSGELFAYFNTLNLSGQTGATISEQATEHATW